MEHQTHQEDQEASSSPLDLPEILYTLVQFLDRYSILQASLVCRDWSRVFAPLLFREVRFEDWVYPGFPELFQKNVDQVVTLEWKKSMTIAKRRRREIERRHLEQQGESVKALRSEQLPLPTLSSICLEDLASVLRPANAHRLRLLVIQGEMELRRFLLTILPQLPTLTCLRIEDSLSWQKISIKEIMGACGPSLLSLDCDSSVALQFDDSFQGHHPVAHSESTAEDTVGGGNSGGAPSGSGIITDNIVSSHSNIHNTMESLQSGSSHLVQQLRVLRLHKTSLSDQELLRLVQECPYLEELYLHQESGAALTGGHHASPDTSTEMISSTNTTTVNIHQWNWSTEFVNDLSKSCSNLTRLYLSPGCFRSLPEEVILKVLDTFPKLHILGVPFSQFGDRAMQEILKTRLKTETDQLTTKGSGTGPTLHSTAISPAPQKYRALTSLNISHLKGSRLSSTMLQAFLEQSTALIHFHGDEHMIRVGDMIADGLQTRTLRPWGCTKLETLVIGFRLLDNNGGDLQKIEFGDHEAIFQQLSLLSRLRKLEILKDGPTYTQRGRMKETGLRLLSTLSLLQSFKIPSWSMIADATSQKDQLDAVHWMAQTWPCLQKLYLPWNDNRQLTTQISYLLHDIGRSNIDLV
ncbi:hypothetical protein BGX27_000590 [Mortierella sp. AM989]|nr:hypothetical protein BGX27_000590 [Mortierella sp. AM989]